MQAPSSPGIWIGFDLSKINMYGSDTRCKLILANYCRNDIAKFRREGSVYPYILVEDSHSRHTDPVHTLGRPPTAPN